jgi:uncharacterized glyoxalase superfamily protein PhnB
LINNQSMPASTIIPVLGYESVPEAVEWLVRVFSFVERIRIADHRVQLNYGAGDLVVTKSTAPSSGQSVMVRVDDVDSHHVHCVHAGAKILQEPTLFPYGERQYVVEDLEGHAWTFSQSVANIDPISWGGTLVEAQPNNSFKPNPLRGSA